MYVYMGKLLIYQNRGCLTFYMDGKTIIVAFIIDTIYLTQTTLFKFYLNKY